MMMMTPLTMMMMTPLTMLMLTIVMLREDTGTASSCGNSGEGSTCCDACGGAADPVDHSGRSKDGGDGDDAVITVDDGDRRKLPTAATTILHLMMMPRRW